MELIETAKQRARLILPKLERMRGDGRNHQLLQHLALVKNYSDMLNKNLTRIPPETLASDLIEICDKAEIYMLEVARC